MSSSLLTPARTRRKVWLSAWLPVVVCIGVIGLESTIFFGADRTSEPLKRIVEFLMHRHFRQPEWWRIHIYIRKGGHFLGYGIQSVAWFRAFWMTWRPLGDPERRLLPTHILAMFGTFCIACCDEFHQTFLPNRTGTAWDVLVDCSGALLLQFFVWLWMRRRVRY
jgi:VanZ family protein